MNPKPHPNRRLLTVVEVAELLGVSISKIRTLIKDADENKKTSAWQYGREIIDLTPSGHQYRCLRFDPAAIAPVLTAAADPPDVQP